MIGQADLFIKTQIGTDLFKLIYEAFDGPKGYVAELIGIATPELIIEEHWPHSKLQGVQGNREVRHGRCITFKAHNLYSN